MILLSASKVRLLVQRDGGIWNFLTWPKKSLRASPASGSESWGSGGGDPSDSPRKSLWSSPRLGWCRTKEDVLSSWSPPTNFIRLSASGNMNSPFSLGNITSFALSLFRVDFWCVHRFQLLKVCNQYVSLPNSTRVQCVSDEQSR